MPKARPTLLINVCEADGRGRGSAGAQGENGGSRHPEEVACPSSRRKNCQEMSAEMLCMCDEDSLGEEEELCQHILSCLWP